ncbi:MAG: PP2C family protein-serine/threonine phosphatase [Bdellovibrionota bacterium]
MSFRLSVFTRDKQREKQWIRELAEATRTLGDVHVEGGAEGQLVFVDAADAGALLTQIDRRGRAVFLIVGETASLPAGLTDGTVDDVLVHPFRALEVFSKIQRYQQLLMWEEVSKLNASFTELLAQLKDDLSLTERLQKAKLPLRFPDVRGFHVGHRYLAGGRPGGDHFDIAEARDQSQLSLVLSDSSSYGLSSSVLSALMRLAVKLTADEARSTLGTVRKIQDELQVTLKEKDRLSLFYGVITRKDLRFRYLNLGTVSLFYASPGKGFKPLPAQAQALVRDSGPVNAQEQEIALEPGSRLALVSDGFLEVAGGAEQLQQTLERYREKPAVDSINELVFRVKSAFKKPDDLPAQDCTVAILDLDARVLRLA